MGKLQKLDNRIQIMLKNGVTRNFRTVFVMVGNKAQDQVPIMHQILNSLSNKGRLSLLWCYKKELSFSTHRKKNLKLLNKKRQTGLTSDATIFEQFICTTDIRWCYYHDTHKILGQTFNMCVLQDFEALTPNLMARTIETVAGGGVIIFLLKSMDSLKQLCTMMMDVHSRYRTDAHQDVVCRFNERFLLSLANNQRCLVLDDQWRVLPLSNKVLAGIKSVPSTNSEDGSFGDEQNELTKLKVALTQDGSPFAPLVQLCITFDQAKALVQFCASISASSSGSGSTDRNTSLLSGLGQSSLLSDQSTSSSAVVVVTASRGRGKSAALGLALAAAFDAGLSNLYVTAPSIDNLGTLNQFVVKGLQALGYNEHQDYTTTTGSSSQLERLIVHRQRHRQSLVYLPPPELATALQARLSPDLVCIDEAAAIPLQLVKTLISSSPSSATTPRLAFMASTVNGYEGTGRSLSLKLIDQLRAECRLASCSTKLATNDKSRLPLASLLGGAGAAKPHPGKGLTIVDTSRTLYEVTLNEAIRYANGDPVESWLNQLLCLDCGDSLISSSSSPSNPDVYYPPVDQCQLFYVNRDTLFSYHKSTETFLHRLMALYVASHYKNSPNDLQLLSDAPSHHIFCLLAPYKPPSDSSAATRRLPEILCVLQVCLEGKINKERVARTLSRGLRPSGDLIPWTISQQFCSPAFGQLSGARVVRIATHPDYQGLGYGSRALKLLFDYYDGKMSSNPASTLSQDVISDMVSSLHSGDEPLSKSKSTKAPPLDDKPPSKRARHQMDDESDEEEEELIDNDDSFSSTSANQQPLLHEAPIERKGPSNLPPLLAKLDQRAPELLDYVGVSFGATPGLLRFWKKAGYAPIYLRQSLNELTGEYSCIMLRQFDRWGSELTSSSNIQPLSHYFTDFSRRFINLLPGCFRHMDAAYGLELLHNKLTSNNAESGGIKTGQLQNWFTPIDRERLKRYVQSLVDFPVISDLLPRLAQLYFTRQLPDARLNKTQQVILLGLGLQHKTVDRLASELDRLLVDNLGGAGKKGGRGDNCSAVMSLAAAATSETAAPTDSNDSSVAALNKNKQASSSWSSRIKGLLFVLLRELHRSLVPTFDELDQAENNLDQQSQQEEAEAMSADSASDDEQEDNSLVDDEQFDNESENLNSSSTGLDQAELQRRTEAVRQLVSGSDGGDLLTDSDQLTQLKVHGSDKEWSRAILGHGSNLEAVNIRLAPTRPGGGGDAVSQNKKGKKRNGDHHHHSHGKQKTKKKFKGRK